MRSYTTRVGPYSGEAFFAVCESLTVGPLENEFYIRHSIDHPGGVSVVPIVGNHVFCVEQYRPAVRRAIIEVPAGRPEANESPEETAHRELQEETGLMAGALTHLGTLYGAPSFSNVEVEVFLATGMTLAKAPIVGDPDEFPLAIRRIRLDQVDELVGRGLISDAMTIASLCLARLFLEQQEATKS